MRFHRAAFLGPPGTGKSTCGLSYPGVEQHVWGSAEEDTADGFSWRKDILEPVKLDWYDCLRDEERAKFTAEPEAGKEMAAEREVAMLTEKARARNIARYRRYLLRTKEALLRGERKDLKTIFMDNAAPFAVEFQDYVKVVYENELLTKEGNFNSIAFAIKYGNEMTDFLRLFYSLPCHTVMSCHVAMNVDEETASKIDFMKDTQKGVKYPKEWQPHIMGKTKYVFAGIPTYAFFMFTEESAGQPTKFLMKLEADSSNVGVSKGRVQPFANPRKISMPKGRFYPVFERVLKEHKDSGSLIAQELVTRFASELLEEKKG